MKEIKETRNILQIETIVECQKCGLKAKKIDELHFICGICGGMVDDVILCENENENENKNEKKGNETERERDREKDREKDRGTFKCICKKCTEKVKKFKE